MPHSGVQRLGRGNNRRNLTSGQWATLAAENEDIMAAIAEQVEKEKAERVSQARRGEVRQIIDSPKNERKADHKAAELFNTNRTYVNQAAKIKLAAPEVFSLARGVGNCVPHTRVFVDQLRVRVGD